MKLFLDTANLAQIRKLNQMGIVDGITTNPTLVAKEPGDFEGIIASICKEVRGDVSAEVVATDFEGMVAEAKRISTIAPNVVVKIPIIPEGLRATKAVSGMGMRVNMTLVFSANQGLLAAKAGASFISPFIGRLDDIGQRGMELVEDLVKIRDNYGLKAEVLVGSIRHPQHVLEAAKAGADIATMPPEVMEKMMQHPLTDSGLKRFLDDWDKAKKSKRSTDG
ncbi:MAG: fructose-6-phosphate aldolase [Nitrososphaerota archaeon]|jgi:transaldolase|nr:fructose-6-phosphate aldolase [Nitrososphaerota archaeon]MDG6959656.1 fructose-6-phosphate aldolase [Nitrososphaerota archaeon]MDG6968933.1 fructose-6-phosphate aldolase [Nitrososphaerota archaeon]MDG6973270.1 fructose-6-phosphate aldolase [Nitrososphaerota archaeon]MDG6976795.1 fructose-6-phosphate aldolase [Nitrososphaerota archaeon]